MTNNTDPVNALVRKAMATENATDALNFTQAALNAAKATALNDLAILVKASIAAQLDNG